MFVFPHGIHVDNEGNVWVTDGQDNMPRRKPGTPPEAPMPPMPEKVVGHQAYKFSPDGKLLLTLGKPGGNQPGQPADPASFYQPNDVVVLPNGDILVAEGHSNAEGTVNRIVRFSRDGKYLCSSASAGGSREFIQPHALALDAEDGSSSAIAATIACKCSPPTASSSPSGRSSADRAASRSAAT